MSSCSLVRPGPTLCDFPRSSRTTLSLVTPLHPPESLLRHSVLCFSLWINVKIAVCVSFSLGPDGWIPAWGGCVFKGNATVSLALFSSLDIFNSSLLLSIGLVLRRHFFSFLFCRMTYAFTLIVTPNNLKFMCRTAWIDARLRMFRLSWLRGSSLRSGLPGSGWLVERPSCAPTRTNDSNMYLIVDYIGGVSEMRDQNAHVCTRMRMILFLPRSSTCSRLRCTLAYASPAM